MKKAKRWFFAFFVFLFGMLMTLFTIILAVGGIMFAHAIVTDTMPTAFEITGMVFLILVGGSWLALFYLTDTEGDGN